MNTWKQVINNVRDFITNLPNRNWVLPFLSMLTATILYIYVNNQKKVEKQANVPLEIGKKTARLTISSEVPKTITVYFSGSKGGISQIDFNSLYAYIDLSSAKSAGTKNYLPKLIGKIPTSVRLLRIYPTRIPIALSKTYRKWVKIEALFINKDKNEYEIKAHSIRPGSTLIVGPQSIVQDIVSLQTEPIDVSKITENTQIEVGINKNTSSFIEFNRNRSYKVKIDVGSKEQSIRVQGPLPVETRGLNPNLGLDEGVKMWIDYVDVVVPSEQAEELYIEKNIVFYADFTDVSGPQYVELEIKYKTSSFIRVEDYQPRSIALQIVAKQTPPVPPPSDEENPQITPSLTNATQGQGK